MQRRPEHFDVIVVGAGAAGLMCAMTAGQRGRRVLILEHTDKIGAKILISGGGRCNFTNVDVATDRFISDNPHFAKSALSRYTQHDFIDLIRRRGIAYHEKTLGQLFCDGSARAIVDMLADGCSAGGVDVRVNEAVRDVTRDAVFSVGTNRSSYTASALVLATGGLSIPKMGATGFSYDMAKRFGLRLTRLAPALVPFTGTLGPSAGAELAGVSFDAVARIGQTRFRENALLTHRGLSGPAILQISSYWDAGETVMLDLVPDKDASAALLAGKRQRPKALVQTLLAELVPSRLAHALAQGLPPCAVADIPDKVLTDFGLRLKEWPYQPSGTEGYAKAEVTLGGVDTRDLSSKTMEATRVPGLYVIGEAVDVTGWLGGYNFQWAWSSGWAAGESV